MKSSTNIHSTMDTETGWKYVEAPPPSYCMATAGCEHSKLQLSPLQVSAISWEARKEKNQKIVCYVTLLIIGVIILMGLTISVCTFLLASPPPPNIKANVSPKIIKVGPPMLKVTQKPVNLLKVNATRKSDIITFPQRNLSVSIRQPMEQFRSERSSSYSVVQSAMERDERNTLRSGAIIDKDRSFWMMIGIISFFFIAVGCLVFFVLWIPPNQQKLRY